MNVSFGSLTGAITLFSSLGPSTASCQTAFAQRDSAIQTPVDSPSSFAGTCPPSAIDSLELEYASRLFTRTVVLIARELDHAPGSGDLEFRLGETYRYGYNLDREGLFANAEIHLQKAMDLSPAASNDCFSPGLLYVNSSMSRAPDAENLFRKIIDLAEPDKSPSMHFAPDCAFCMQGKFSEAEDSIELHLRAFPENKQGKSMQKIIDMKLRH